MTVLQRISKAIAAGIAAAAGGSTTAYLIIPPGLSIPPWVYLLIPGGNFVLGFVLTYLAPPNS